MNIALIEDTEEQRILFSILLEKFLNITVVCFSGRPADKDLEHMSAILCDVRLNNDVCGAALATYYKQKWPEKPVGVLTTASAEDLNIPSDVFYFDKMRHVRMIEELKHWLGVEV